MSIRMIMLAGATSGALWLGGCTPPHPHHYGHALKTIDALDCPDSEGDLTRKSESADSKTCVYADGSDALVTLQLVSLNGGDAKNALAPIEDDLKAELPPKSGETSDNNDGGNGRVDIDLPGIHIHASGKDGDKSDDKGEAKIDIGGAGHGSADGGPGVSIDAHDKDARISINESGSGVRLSYIQASDSPGPHGFKSVSYDARGPSAGPLAVVSIKSKSDDVDDLRDAARALLKRNVGN
jgi:hypothetical protein